jgi:hypothetical protein
MKSLRMISLLLTFLLMSASACSRDVNPEQELRAFLKKTEKASREFIYRETARDRTINVVGRVQDDLRYSQVLNVDGTNVMETVVADDALAVRLISPEKATEFASIGAFTSSQIIGDALTSGQWVLDHAAAPPLSAPVTREGQPPVGENAVLDAAYLFQYLERAIAEGRDVWEFDEDDISYKPSEDPFEKPNRDAGIKRYDVRPPLLPRRSARGTESALPSTAHFRKLSFYVREDKLIRVEEVIDFESHPEFLRAKRGEGSDFLKEQLESVRGGRTREPLPLRRMTTILTRVGAPTFIELPTGDVLVASLGGFFGSQAPADAETEPPG